MYRPAQFCLNFPFASWTGAQISFNTRSPNFKSLVLYFCQKLSWVSLGILECDTRLWVFSHPACMTSHIRFATNLLKGFHFSIPSLMNEHPFPWEGLLPSHIPMNKEWLLWRIELMFYTPRMRRAIVDASPCNFLGFSSKFALCFCLQPQLLH